MIAKRALALVLVVSLLVAGIPSRAHATEGTKGLAAFEKLLFHDAEVEQLLDSVVSELSPATVTQIEQLAQLAVSGATPTEIEQQARVIVSSLPEPTQASFARFFFAFSYLAGLAFMVAAVFKFK